MAEREAAGKSAMIPTLYLRKDRPKPGSMQAAAVGGPMTQKAGLLATTGAGAIDAREFMEEIDLLKRMKATEFATLVVSIFKFLVKFLIGRDVIFLNVGG